MEYLPVQIAQMSVFRSHSLTQNMWNVWSAGFRFHCFINHFEILTQRVTKGKARFSSSNKITTYIDFQWVWVLTLRSCLVFLLFYPSGNGLKASTFREMGWRDYVWRRRRRAGVHVVWSLKLAKVFKNIKLRKTYFH